MQLNSHNEWDPLKEIIVGRAESIAPMVIDKDQELTDEQMEEAFELARKAYPSTFIDEINEDLEELCDVCREYGATVHRPDPSDQHTVFSTPWWKAVGCNSYNARDLYLVVGNKLIESPSHVKWRYFEATAYYDIFYDHYFDEGMQWIAGPKPRLKGDYREVFYEDAKRLHKLKENEIMFEAANTARMGRDLLYLVSSSGNYKGAKWLQSVLGEEYTVHVTDDIYRSSHIDSTVLCLRPGLVLLNGFRVDEDNCPEIFDSWDKIYFDDITPYPQEVIDFQDEVRHNIAIEMAKLDIRCSLGISSEWIGMNFLSLDPETAVVEKRQKGLIDVLEKQGITVIPIEFRHSYFMGGIHCSTLDTVRDSKLESYFD